MCNDKNLFDDLEDTEYWNKPAPAAKVSEHQEDISNLEIPGFVEDCPKCRGTGSWRPGYKCFKCKGTGKLQFKTAPEARAKARKYSQKRKATSANKVAKTWMDWLHARPAIHDWFKSNEDSTFANSLFDGGQKYGHLTEKQEAAVLKAIARDEDQKLGFANWCKQFDGLLDWLTTESDNGNEFAASLLTAGLRYGSLTERQLAAVQKNLDNAREYKASDLDISGLKGYYSVPDGSSRLKICIRHKGKNSRLHGWIFVDDGAEYGSRQNYGKQAPGGTYQGKVQDALKKILENPLEAQIAYGKLTETCGYCGRKLEDPQSVAAGIGPICAAKYS